MIGEIPTPALESASECRLGMALSTPEDIVDNRMLARRKRGHKRANSLRRKLLVGPRIPVVEPEAAVAGKELGLAGLLSGPIIGFGGEGNEFRSGPASVPLPLPSLRIPGLDHLTADEVVGVGAEASASVWVKAAERLQDAQSSGSSQFVAGETIGVNRPRQ